MLKSDQKILAQSEKICEECGKVFTVISSDMWAYKLTIKTGTIYFCRYNCCRAGEKKRDNEMRAKKENAGRNTELKANKPKKGVLEKDLMLGLTISQIAKKYEASVQTIHNWIKSYEIAGVQGEKKPVDKPVVPKVYEKPILEEIVPPTPAEIEQFHTDVAPQEFPKIESPVTSQPFIADPENEFPPIPMIAPAEETLEDIWDNIKAGMPAAKKKYAEQADKDFSDHLVTLVLAVTNGRGI